MTLLPAPFDSAAHSIAQTLRAAKDNMAQKIDLPKDTYHIYADERQRLAYVFRVMDLMASRQRRFPLRVWVLLPGSVGM